MVGVVVVVLAIHHLIFVVLGLGIPVVLIEFKKLILGMTASLEILCICVSGSFFSYFVSNAGSGLYCYY